MFSHILVPLDGSALAESVIGHVRGFARTPDTRVTLLHLIERSAPTSVHGDNHLRTVPEAEAYLEQIAAHLRADGITADTHVDTNETGNTAQRIVYHGIEWHVDLIALCAHGRGGVGRLFFGSIAQSVLAVGIAPVLLVIPAAGSGPAPVTLRHLLVPLDGTAEAEAALPLMETIAAAFQSTVHLVLVVQTLDTLTGSMSSVARFSPSVTDAFLARTVDDAKTYLHGLADRLRSMGITVQAQIERGDPATAIVHMEKRIPADLTLIATHGRAGLEGVWTGSVGNKILARSSGPFLLIRAPGSPQTRS